MTADQSCVPNHHAHFPGFAGPIGFLAAAIMALGGKGRARLAGQLSGLAAGEAVADIGCGPGTAARHAARLGAQVTGVDPAPVMLRVARLLTRRSAHPVRYIEGSAEEASRPRSRESRTIARRRRRRPDGRPTQTRRLSRCSPLIVRLRALSGPCWLPPDIPGQQGRDDDQPG